MDASGWAIIIGAIFLGVTQVVSMVLAYLREQQKIERDRLTAEKVEEVRQAAAVAASKVVEVKNALAIATVKTDAKDAEFTRQLTDIAEVGAKTHELCNSAMLEQKRIHSVKCRATADKTKDPVDVAEAAAAEEVYQEHKAKQARMEAKDSRGAT